ncbi:hypothetical protein SSE37_24459 [Sagittula stellata E-37]|uniref:Uncharacterized protein n=1 Tax=Sagittula stellata (strain ATCC 700073 / DSM 11524 / E-37) TaxID=388399 RepID=A3K0Y7_SAGS3|nr:hypothetical protein SSE37_24459 [Sagittula stellata E-37]
MTKMKGARVLPFILAKNTCLRVGLQLCLRDGRRGAR